MLRQHLLVLGWHNVESSWCFPSRPGLGLSGLTKQLQLLRRTANVIPLADALHGLAEGTLPSRAVALTFDDGYRDNLDLAVPLLEDLGLPATFFLVPAILSGEIDPWWEKLAWAFRSSTRPSLDWEGRCLPLGDVHAAASLGIVAEALKRRCRAARHEDLSHLIEQLAPQGRWRTEDLFLDWVGARELVGRGFTVGSHSLRHDILSEEGAEQQHFELSMARERLERGLQVRVDLLAYPNGTERDYDASTMAAARQSGYVAALTTRGGWNTARTPMLEIRRFVVYPEHGVRELVDICTWRGRVIKADLEASGRRLLSSVVGRPG